jgi:hypothetical protein
MEERAEYHRVAEEALIQDLRAVGISVESVWDLVNTRATYPQAVPVLLEHLRRDNLPVVREGIARALAVPEAAPAWPLLLELFRLEPAGGARDVKWGLAVALAGASTEDVVDTMLEMMRDRRLGKYRLAWIGPLLRSQNPEAREALESLREDPDLKKQLRVDLGRPRRSR